MFFGDADYKESMKQLLFQIIVYNFNVYEVSLKVPCRVQVECWSQFSIVK